MIKLSSAMRRTLLNIEAGRKSYFGLSGKSAFGGHMQTLSALHKRGFLAIGGAITEAGLAELHPDDSHTVILTVADHERDGFVNIARMLYPTELAARALIDATDAKVDDDAEPDLNDATFWFILDLHKGDSDADCIDNSRRRLPTQIARQIAPDLVDRWLATKPDPDEEAAKPIPRIQAVPA